MPYICVQDRPGNKPRKGLLMDECKWKELEGIVTQAERLAKLAEMNAKSIQERKDLSSKMQSEWDNTYLNMRKKRFEEMEARKVMLEAEREKKYWQLRRDEQDLREQITAKAKSMMNQQKDYTKNINRALVLAEVLRERKIQVDFNNKLREQEIEREIDYAKSIKEDVEKYNEEEFQKHNVRGEHREKLKRAALTEVKHFQDAKLKEELEKKLEGQEELRRLKIEIKEEEEKERLEKIKQKQIAISNIEENLRMKAEYKRRQRLEDEEEDTKIRIISEVKKRLNNERKKKEKADQEASIARRNKIAKAVAAVSSNYEEEENERIARAQAEKDSLDEQREKNDLAHIEKMKQERIKSFQIYNMEEEKRKHDEYEVKKWAMLQRFKKEEANRKFDEEDVKKAHTTTLDSRIYWNKQIRERKDKEQKEVEEDVDALNRALEVWKEEDKYNLKYAEDILEECSKIGRPTYPLEAVLKDYKKVIGLIPQRPLSATWKSNIPIFNPAVEEEAERRRIDRPRIRPKCACIPRNGIFF